MREWSMGEAIAAGFRLIGREPMAFAAWVVVYAIVGLGPQALGMVAGFNTLATLGASAGGPDPTAVAEAMGPLQALQPLSVVTSILSAILLYGAVYRAVLLPEDRRFLYLRVGVREMWMVLTMLALVVMLILAMFALIIPTVLVVGVGGAAAGSGGAGTFALISLVLFLGVFGVLIWGGVRMSLAMPMAFARKRFPIPDAWRQTKGHGLRLFGVFAMLYLVFIVLEVLMIGIGAGAALAVAPMEELSRLMTTNPMALFTKVNPAIWVAIAAVWSIFGAGFATLIAAASAQIYKDLTPPDPAEVFA